MCPPDEELSAYFDGELSAEDRSVLTDHLKVCARCRGQLREVERGSATLRRLFQRTADGIPVPESVLSPAHGAPSRRRWFVAAAAALFVVLTLCWSVFLERPETASPPSVSSGEVAVVVYDPAATPLRADTLSLALAGDVDAQIQLRRLGWNGGLVRADAKPSRVSTAVPTVEEMDADQQRYAVVAQRIMGGER